MEKWIFYIIIVSGLFSALSSLFQKISLSKENSDPLAFGLYFQILIGAISIPTAFLQPMKIDFNSASVITILLMAVAYAAATCLYFYALQRVDMSEFNILISSSMLITIIGAFFFLKEQITANKLTGVFLIIVGIALIYIKKSGFSKFGKNHILILLCALLWSVAAVLDKFNLNFFSSPSSYMVFSYLLPALLIFLTNPSRYIKNLSIIKTNKKSLALSVILSYFSTVLFFYALQLGGEISNASPIHHISIVFAVLLGIVLLKEHTGWKHRIIGSIVIFIGTLFLK